MRSRGGGSNGSAKGGTCGVNSAGIWRAGLALLQMAIIYKDFSVIVERHSAMCHRNNGSCQDCEGGATVQGHFMVSLKIMAVVVREV